MQTMRQTNKPSTKQTKRQKKKEPVAVAKRCELQVFNTPCLVMINYFNEMLRYEKKSEKIR